ncbi:MAG: hypothetical protein IPK26_06525 [Planctomycetes bacterium]|nr:hypothetical protein [Planctomycetota bacterium]
MRAPALVWLAVFGSCQQLPQKPADAGVADARYVDAAVLTHGHDHSGVILTAVPLQHISAADAEARLRPTLPAGVSVNRVGEAAQLLIQGPGSAVRVAIEQLQRIDVR